MCRRIDLQRCVAGMVVALLLAAHARAEEKYPQAAEADVNLRFAQASLRVAEAELAQALEANKKSPGAISQSEVRRLSLAVERAKIEVERAELQKKSAMAEPNTVVSKAGQPQFSESEMAIRRALDEKSSLQVVEMPLADVIEYLRGKHKISIQVDQKALDDAGIGSDTPITRELEGISLRSLLNLLLRENELTYVIKDEVMLITTRAEANQLLEIVVYDVVDLVKEGFSGAGDNRDVATLIELITSTIAPTTWDEVGGPGSIGPFDGMMVISQTQAVHAKMAEFFATLRKTRAVRPAQQPATMEQDSQQVSMRVYKINVPLLPTASLPKQAGPVAANEEGSAGQRLGQFGGGGLVGGTPGQKPSGETVLRSPDPRYLESLVDVITSTVEPESWKAVGGQGVIQALPANASGVGTLVIKQSAAVHSQIERLIKEVEATAAGGLGGGGFF